MNPHWGMSAPGWEIKSRRREPTCTVQLADLVARIKRVAGLSATSVKSFFQESLLVKLS
jgi:hypothetical protein